MDADFLSKLNKSGAQALLPASATLFEREQLAKYIGKLKALGHALICDEVTESGELAGAIKICHYLSCKRCAEDANRNIS